MPPRAHPLLRADTWAQLGGLVTDFAVLLLRLGGRAITAFLYGMAGVAGLYLFVIHGWAFFFARAAQRAFVATFVANGTALSEF